MGCSGPGRQRRGSTRRKGGKSRSKHWNVRKLIRVDKEKAVISLGRFQPIKTVSYMDGGGEALCKPRCQVLTEPHKTIWGEYCKTVVATHQAQFSYFILSHWDFSLTNIKLHLTPPPLHTRTQPRVVQSSRHLRRALGCWERRFETGGGSFQLGPNTTPWHRRARSCIPELRFWLNGNRTAH